VVVFLPLSPSIVKVKVWAVVSLYIYLSAFLERGREGGRERKREKNNENHPSP